ncbi:MAG: pas/pac sensor protein [Bacteroidetes bacterium]|jgi:PAS domain S-box-containing protein|nr:pas/pac sensor protein [Bacteroidota bacterium]
MQTFSELVLDKLDTLVVVVESNGNVAYVSNSVKKLLGYEPEQLLGEQWWTRPRISEAEGIEIKRKIKNLLAADSSRVSQSFEHALKTSQGHVKWFKWSSSVINDNQLVGIGLDITDKKASEQRILDINRSLTDRNKEITDSINYAQKIQQAILPNPAFLQNNFSDGFVLYQPKDIVSGDYYFFHETEDKRYVAAIDCTGHGVPGAMMSVIANSLLKEVFLNKKVSGVDEILYQLDELLFEALNRNNTDEIRHDGMDISLCAIDKKTNLLEFAGAMRPLLIVRNEQIIEIKGSKFPLGFFDYKKEFVKHELELEDGDMIYLSSDGYCDQFGGDRNKKMNRRAFKELLLSIAPMNGEEQEAFLEYAHKNWKQDEEQTDDILVIGIRI